MMRNVVWVVIGEILYEFSEVLSVWGSEEAAKAAAEEARAGNERHYDYVEVERHEVG
jgi:hypothetical protein